jgi:hypothetical protein
MTLIYQYELLVENPFLLLILSLAAFRITRVITTDNIAEDLRDAVWKKFPPSTKIGYLLTCNWCMGLWVALAVFISWLLAPEATVVVSLVLSISAIIGLISAWTER